METQFRGGAAAGFSSLRFSEPANASSVLLLRSPSPHHLIHGSPSRRSFSASVSRNSLPGSAVSREDVMQMFVKEREANGDFITKASDLLWRRDDLKQAHSETSSTRENLQQHEEEVGEDSTGGFLKLTETREWVSGDSIAPVNKRLVVKDWQNDSEKRKQLNFLRYEALKRELLLVTAGVGAACTGYCLISLSVEAAISYAVGVLCSCLYLQLLYHHTDNISKEAISRIFMQKKLKKIGIRSEDLKIMFEKAVSGSTMALSSPRLVIPAAIYGFWALSNHYLIDYFDFQLVPGIVGFFAYKAAALVQVYRDNEGLQIVFPDNEDGSRNS